MNEYKKLLGLQLWCSVCKDKRPPRMHPSFYLVFKRLTRYEMIEAEVDKTLVGVCEECLDDKNEFQISTKKKIVNNDIHRIYTKL